MDPSVERRLSDTVCNPGSVCVFCPFLHLEAEDRNLLKPPTTDSGSLAQTVERLMLFIFEGQIPGSPRWQLPHLHHYNLLLGDFFGLGSSAESSEADRNTE